MSALIGPALDALRAGLCVVPPRQDGSKAPEGFWRAWQSRRPDETTVSTWYSAGRTGIGYVCGAVSGGLEMFEFEDARTHAAFVATADALALGDLVERVSGGYESLTPGGGVHWLYRSSDIAGNTKLACRPKLPEEQTHERDTVAVLIETRGEGGYTVEAPSSGTVHPSGAPYRLRRGSVETIATITPAERRQLWNLARTFDQLPESMPRAEARPLTSSVIDEYNRRTTWQELLVPDGWTLAHQRGGVLYWRRPGKDRGVSAVSGYNAEDRLAVYSTSTELETGRGHSKFAYFAQRNHGGDFKSAHRALAGAQPAQIHSSGTTTLIPDERKKLFRTAREITAETPTTPSWILEGYLAEGTITELDGKLKASGKTTLIMAALAKIVDGQPFLGRATARTGAIVLSEQNSPSLSVALGRAGLADREDVLVMFWSDARDLTWPLIVQVAAEEARQRGYRLIVVDTLPQFAGIAGDGENSSGAALEAMRPIQEAAASGLAFLISRHERKGGGEVGESARGSSAFSGAVDIVLSLRRTEGQGSDTVRAIHALSRFDETPSELLIDLVDGEYVALGSGPDVRQKRARDAILAELPLTPDRAVTRDQLIDALADSRIKPTMLHGLLKDAVEAGIVQRSGSGRKNDPYRYWKSQKIHSFGAPVVPDESISDIVDEAV